MKSKLSILAFFLLGTLQAQVAKNQTISGKVIDRTTRQTLIGATVEVVNLDNIIGTVTDENGEFILENVPVGRRNITCRYIGYDTWEEAGLVLTTAKTVNLVIELGEASVLMEEAIVKAYRNPSEPQNELAVLSTRSFSAEETERFAASVNDPGRMALSFPGVQQGGDDTENDIIIRGNSSIGMLWRLEGIDIPNPNHFARPGTSGGGVTVFSAQLLSRSDFSTGAMPAEYGNAISGSMDMHFRKGNKQERAYRAKVSLLGLDAATEGPIQKGKSSYLVNYRYSTLGLLSSAGIYVVGERVDNDFQDLSFNLAFDGKSGKDFVTVFGLSGLSTEHYIPVAKPEERELGEANQWEDRVRVSNMAAIGMTYTRLLDEKSYLKWVVAGMGSDIDRVSDTLNLQDERWRYNTEKYLDQRLATSLTYSRKFSPKLKLKTGVHFNQIAFDFFKQTRPRSSSSDVGGGMQEVPINIKGEGSTQTFQYYAQFSYQLAKSLTANIGGHFLFLNLNKTKALEPRVSLRYQPSAKHEISLAYGLHSQHLPLGIYFFQNEENALPNANLKFMQNQHLIGGWKWSFANNLRLQTEVYYQLLNNIPVQTDPTSTYWYLNSQAGFPEFAMTNNGGGRNIGVDMAMEKYFSGGFYGLLRGSIFKSEYSTQGDNYRPSKFSTGYSTGLTAGKEWTYKSGNTLQAGGRAILNGGFRYTPHDVQASAAAGQFIPDLNNAWSAQVPAYFRIDTRVAYRWNKTASSMLLSLDVQNITNHANYNRVAYNVVDNSLELRKYPAGLVPVLSFEIDF